MYVLLCLVLAYIQTFVAVNWSAFTVSDDMRPVICIRRAKISDADVSPVNDVEKLLTHSYYLYILLEQA